MSDQGVIGAGHVVIVPGAGVAVAHLTAEVQRAVGGVGRVQEYRGDSWGLESEEKELHNMSDVR